MYSDSSVTPMCALRTFLDTGLQSSSRALLEGGKELRGQHCIRILPVHSHYQYYTVWYHTVGYHTVGYYTVWYYTVWYYTVGYYTVGYYSSTYLVNSQPAISVEVQVIKVTVDVM